jgi:hypothetical protein
VPSRGHSAPGRSELVRQETDVAPAGASQLREAHTGDGCGSRLLPCPFGTPTEAREADTPMGGAERDAARPADARVVIQVEVVAAGRVWVANAFGESVSQVDPTANATIGAPAPLPDQWAPSLGPGGLAGGGFQRQPGTGMGCRLPNSTQPRAWQACITAWKLAFRHRCRAAALNPSGAANGTRSTTPLALAISPHAGPAPVRFRCSARNVATSRPSSSTRAGVSQCFSATCSSSNWSRCTCRNCAARRRRAAARLGLPLLRGRWASISVRLRSSAPGQPGHTGPRCRAGRPPSWPRF